MSQVLVHNFSISLDGFGTGDGIIDATPHEALDLARDAAGDLDVRIGGGPTVVRDFLVAGLIDTRATPDPSNEASPGLWSAEPPQRRHNGGVR